MPATHEVSKTPLEKLLGLAMWGPGLARLTSSLSALRLVQRFVEPDRIDWLTRIYTRGQVLGEGIDGAGGLCAGHAKGNERRCRTSGIVRKSSYVHEADSMGSPILVSLRRICLPV